MKTNQLGGMAVQQPIAIGSLAESNLHL